MAGADGTSRVQREVGGMSMQGAGRSGLGSAGGSVPSRGTRPVVGAGVPSGFDSPAPRAGARPGSRPAAAPTGGAASHRGAYTRPVAPVESEQYRRRNNE